MLNNKRKCVIHEIIPDKIKTNIAYRPFVFVYEDLLVKTSMNNKLMLLPHSPWDLALQATVIK